MRKKEKLIIALKRGLHLEEDFIIRLGPRCRACVASSQLSQAEKEEVETILSVLESDSVRHKETVENLIEKMGTEEKDGHQKNTI